MNRRELIRYTALVSGAAVCSPLLSALLSGCSTKVDDVDYTPKFFNQDDFKLVKKLVDVILPKTESPAASEVGVHKVMDQLIGTAYRTNEKADYQKRFDAMSSYLKEHNFDNLNEIEKLEMLNKLGSISEEHKQAARSGFLEFKQQTVALYLSTEEIATTYLNYLPIPGEYNACISLTDVNNKAWAI